MLTFDTQAEADFLRPIEILELLDETNEESASDKDALIAVMKYLQIDGYIKIDNEVFELTPKGKKALDSSNNLRDYELEILEAIQEEYEEDYVEGIMSAIYDTSFEDMFIEKGIYTVTERNFLTLTFSRKVEISDEGDILIDDIIKIRKIINDAAAITKNEIQKIIVFLYAFPSLLGENPSNYSLDKSFSKCIDYIINTYNEEEEEEEEEDDNEEF